MRRHSPPGESARLHILILHRLLAEPDALLPGEMDAARFDRMLGWVRSWFNVLPLDEAVARLATRTLPARAAAITFDDGYACNTTRALPLLQRHGLTATVFVATDFLDGGRMWNDSVIDAVRGAPDGVLDLEPLGLGRHPLHTLDERRAAVGALLGALKYRPIDERRDLAEAVLRRAGGPDDRGKMMTSAQLRAWRDGGMQVGAHTAGHPILARCDDDRARREIVGGRDRLQDVLQAPVSLFAYPNGGPGRDYDARHVEMVRDAGFVAAVSTAHGAARAGDDPLQLPRYSPWRRSRLGAGLQFAQAYRARPARATAPPAALAGASAPAG